MDVYIVTENGRQRYTTLNERDARAMFDRVVRFGHYEHAALLHVPSTANDRIAVIREARRDGLHCQPGVDDPCGPKGEFCKRGEYLL